MFKAIQVTGGWSWEETSTNGELIRTSGSIFETCDEAQADMAQANIQKKK